MLFNSFEFLYFLPVVTLVYYLLPHKLRWLHLLAASCYFYAFFVPAYLAVIFFLTGVAYVAGLGLEKHSGAKRRRLLWLSVLLIVLVLCFFKYSGFIASGLNALLRTTGVSSFSVPLNILFPLGLSFQVFQLLSYLFEVNEERVTAEKHFGLFALSVLFFAKLTAGPIERPQGFLHQLREEKFANKSRIVAGLKIMLWGFFKKIVIADRLGLYVDEVYLQPGVFGSPAVWLAVFVFFPFQLYCDFSGYSSIAVGSAKLLGFDLVENFRRPFSSLTTSEFWNRWHVSLSSWLRDYVYQPVVIFFRRYGKSSVVIGLMVTFLVSGIWHGASWNFLVYGLAQGSIITLEFLLGIKTVKMAKTTAGRWCGRLATYLLWSVTLVFFRSADLSQSLTVLDKLFVHVQLPGFLPGAIPKLTYALGALSVAFLLYFENRHLDRWIHQRGRLRRELGVASSLAVALIALGVFHKFSFIYFQF